MTVLFCDLETYSDVPITYGTHAYAQGAEVMLWTYAIDDGEPKCWDLTDPATPRMPADLEAALRDQSIRTVWHNGGMFDRIVLKYAMAWVYRLLPVSRVHDTMAQALAHGLPGSLEKLCGVMGVPQADSKDKAGKALIQLFCKPRPQNYTLRRATRDTHPVEWARFIAYAKQDIPPMRALYKKLPTWNFRRGNRSNSIGLWELDQKINERGVMVDVELAQAALAAIGKAQKILNARTAEQTNDEVQSANQRDALLAHILKDYGVELPDMKSSTLERRIADENLDEGCRELLRIRLQSATTSTAKYKTLLRSNVGGVLYGLLQFCGASRTRRWSGKVWQPQNLPRPDMENDLIDIGIAALKAGMADVCFDGLPTKPGKEPLNVMKLCANALRGSIVARPGRKLVVSDLSNIEGRKAAWLAEEQWKLDAFAEIDSDPTLPDIYQLAYARAFNVDPRSVNKYQRQIGKVMELALGYEGGVGAFLTFVHTYKLDLVEMTAAAMPTLPADVIAKARGMLEWRKRKRMTTYGVSDDTFIVCESLKAMWRAAHPQISSYWKELEEAARQAILHPGVTQPCRRLSFRKDGAWLRMILPNGDSVCYPSAGLKGDKIYYYGVDQYTRKWQKIYTYGGKLFENACQASSRDVMASAMEEAEMYGYQILLTIHDELITEAPDNDNYSVKELSRILATNRDWNQGLPLNAAGFEGYRYRKD